MGWESGWVMQHMLRYRRPGFQPQHFKVNKQITQNLHILNTFLLSCYWTQEHMSPRREHVSFKEKWKQLFCSKQCSLTKHLLYFPSWSASRFTADPTLPQSSCVRDMAILILMKNLLRRSHIYWSSFQKLWERAGNGRRWRFTAQHRIFNSLLKELWFSAEISMPHLNHHLKFQGIFLEPSSGKCFASELINTPSHLSNGS